MRVRVRVCLHVPRRLNGTSLLAPHTHQVADMKLCFPAMFAKSSFLGTARVIQVLDSTRLDEAMATKILDKEVSARRR